MPAAISGSGSTGGTLYDNPTDVTWYLPESSSSDTPDAPSPGSFSLDITSPAALGQSVGAAAESGGTFIDAIGKALFAKEGSILGGVPVLGDLGRFLGDNPVSKAVTGAIGTGVDALGNALERIPSGNADLTPDYQKLSAELRAKYDAQIAADPSRAQHLMYTALQEQARVGQQKSPDLFWDLKVPTGSLADSVGRVLGLLGVPERYVERGFAGWSRSMGQDRIGELGGDNMSPVEQTAYDKVSSGEWTRAQALDFLASNGAGFSSDPRLQLAATALLDPLTFGSVGAAGLAKLGATGATLSEDVTRLNVLGSSGRLNVLGKLGESEGVTSLLRSYGEHVYAPLEASQLGRVAKLARTVIDPLHAIGQNSVQGEALVDVLTDASVAALRDSVGVENALGVQRWARQYGAAFQDRLLQAESDYTTNLARGAVMTGARDEALALGYAEELRGASQGEVLDAILAEARPKDLRTLLREEVDRVTVKVLDDAQRQDLATSLSRMHGTLTPAEILTDLNKMKPDALAYLHGVVYGQATRDFLKARQAALTMPYDGTVSLGRLNLMNRSTLGRADLEALVERLQSDLSVEQKIEALRQAQEDFPALRYITLPVGDMKARDLERVIAGLERKLEDAALPVKIKPEELKALPAPLREWAENYPTRDLGFAPPDDLKWGMERDPLSDKWHATFEPWNDAVTYDGPIYRPMSSLAYNAAGMPVLGPVGKVAGRMVDAIEAGTKTWTRAISTRMYLANAEKRMIRSGVAVGATEQEMRQVFRGVNEIAQLDRHTARGLNPQSLWDKMQPLLPRRLETKLGWGPRELMNHVLTAFEGDFRVVGMTQKLTGRTKTLLGFAGNYTGQLAEGLYPNIKFRFNPFFQAQEKIEAPVWLVGRGVTPVLGRRTSEADRIFARIADRASETGVMRGADFAEMAEYTPAVLSGGNEIVNRLRGATGQTLANLADVSGQRLISKLRVQEANLGRPIRESFEKYLPGEWQEMASHYSELAGHALNDNEVAARWLAGQALGNKVHIENWARPGMSFADFRSAAISEPFLPASIGEIKTLNIDWLTEMLEMRVGAGKAIKDPTELARALQRGDLHWEDVADTMERFGFQPEYVNRVKRALEFNWDGFWSEVKASFNTTPQETRSLQEFVSRMAESRGATPVEYLSQIMLPEVREGVSGAILGNLGDALAVLRAPEDATFATLTEQLSKIFSAHLDPSGREVLLDAFGGRAGAVAEALRERVLAGVPSGNPEVERIFRQFGEWAENAINNGLLIQEDRYGELLDSIFRLPREGAAPFNMSQQLLVHKAAEAMRLGEEDAFRLLYYKRNRTLFERSVNHPFFGIYPVSYMWGKVLPEMVRFIAKEPFGIHTGAAAYALNDVSMSLAIQREWDPAFDEMMTKVGRSKALYWLGYMLPAVPWDVGAAAPAIARDIAQQALDNQARVKAGKEPKPIDLHHAFGTIVDYVSPVRGFDQMLSAADAVDKEVLNPKADKKAAGPPKATPMGVPDLLGPSSGGVTQQVGEAVSSATDQLSQVFGFVSPTATQALPVGDQPASADQQYMSGSNIFQPDVKLDTSQFEDLRGQPVPSVIQ